MDSIEKDSIAFLGYTDLIIDNFHRLHTESEREVSVHVVGTFLKLKTEHLSQDGWSWTDKRGKSH